MAPRADLILVAASSIGPPGCPATGVPPVPVISPSDRGVIDGVRYIFTQAGAPAVVNISRGHDRGPKDGTSPYEQMLSALTGENRLIVKSAGNNGDVANHADNVAAGRPPAAAPGQRTTFNVPANSRLEEIQIWHALGDSYQIAVTRPGAAAPLVTVAPGNAPAPTTVVVGAGMLSVRVQNRTANLQRPRGHGIDVLITSQGVNIPAGQWTFSLRSVAVAGDGLWDAWINGAGQGTAQFASPAADGKPTNARKLTEPGNAANVVTVAAHNTKRGGTNPFPGPLGWITGFSNPGPTRDGRLKPDISAPGNRVMSSLSSQKTIAPPAADVDPVMGRHFLDQGTSMAAPHVTGCLALMLQQATADGRRLDPPTALATLTALARTDAQSALRRKDDNGNGLFDTGDMLEPAGHWNRDFGWGKLNCALKADDVTGAGGAFFSVRNGMPAAVNAADLLVGDRNTRNLGINRTVLGLAAGDELAAFTFRIDPATLQPPPFFSGVEFSVAPGSQGQLGTDVRRHDAGHRAGHVWRTRWPFAAKNFSATNVELYSETELGLAEADADVDALEIENPFLPVRDPGGAAPVTTFPPVGAFPIDTPPAGGIDVTSYFVLGPGSPSLGARTAAHVLRSNGDGAIMDFRTPAQLGLAAGDHIDALFIDHLDFVRFSLAAGSPTLAAIGGASAAALLQPRSGDPPAGPPVVYMLPAQLGLLNEDELDAVDVEICRFTAIQEFKLRNSTRVGSGAYVEVTDPMTGQLRVGRGTRAEDGGMLAGRTVRIRPDAEVANVAAREVVIQDPVTVRGVRQESAAQTLPTADSSVRTPATCQGAPGEGNDISVPPDTTQTKPPTAYGRVTIGRGATLRLSPGAFTFCSLTIRNGGTLEVLGPTGTSITVIGDVIVQSGGKVQPLAGVPPPRIEIGGTRFIVRQDATIIAHVRAVRAQVRLGGRHTFLGSLLAKSVTSGRSAKFGCVAGPYGG